MKKIGAEKLLNVLIRLMRDLSEEAKKEFGSLSKEQLNWSPSDKQWSIAQCLAHLNAYSRYYVPVLKERVTNTRFRDPATIFVSSPLGSATYLNVKLGKLNNVKRKLKSPRDYNPLVNTGLDVENAYNEFLDFQTKFAEVMEEAKEVNIRKAKCSLSVTPMIKLRIGDVFMYIVYHTERHIEQAKNIKKLKSFPA